MCYIITMLDSKQNVKIFIEWRGENIFILYSLSFAALLASLESSVLCKTGDNFNNILYHNLFFFGLCLSSNFFNGTWHLRSQRCFHLQAQKAPNLVDLTRLGAFCACSQNHGRLPKHHASLKNQKMDKVQKKEDNIRVL
jgi:hypothetical protein